jgi:O-antigen/teichoic acid export membrane protein
VTRPPVDAYATEVVPTRTSPDALVLLLMRCTWVGLELLCGIAIARLFGAQSYGSYAYAMSWAGLLQIPAAMGFDRFLIREISVFRTRSDWPSARALLRFSHRTVLCAAVALGVAGALLAPVLAPPAERHVADAILLAMLMVPIVALSRLRQATLQGLGYTVAGYTPECLVQPITLLCALLAWHLWPAASDSGAAAVALQLVAVLAALLVGSLILRARLPAEYRRATTGQTKPGWFVGSVPFVWMLGMNVVMTNVDTVIVGMVAGSAQAGIYRVTSQMAMLVLLPVTTVSAAMASPIASLYASARMADLERMARRAGGMITAAGVIVATLLIAGGALALRLFGDEFVGGYASLVMLGVAYAASCAAGVASYLLMMSSYARTVSIVATVGAAGNTLLCLALVRIMGIEGAALATGISTLAVSAAYMWFVYVKLRMRVAPNFRELSWCDARKDTTTGY